MPTVEAARVVLVHRPVLAREAIAIYVARRDETTWFVGGPNFNDDDSSQFERLPFASLLDLDSSISELENLPVGHCAFRSDHSEPWSYAVVPVGPTFLVSYDVRPDESNEQRDAVGGAIVTCWVITESLESALLATEVHLAETGWVIVERTKAERLDPDDHARNEYFSRRKSMGWSLCSTRIRETISS